MIFLTLLWPSSTTTTLIRHCRCCHDRLLQGQQVDKALYDDLSAFHKMLLSIEFLLPEVDFTNPVWTSPLVKECVAI
jgi:hypothetical protein